MSSVGVVVEISGLQHAEALLARLGSGLTEELMTNIGAALESSTRKRISETKTSPDGAAWVPNRAGTSILQQTGRHLLDSVAFIASATDVEVGSSWEHAHVHQDGATITPKTAKPLAFAIGGQTVFAKKVTIPARPFVGLSEEDEREIERLTSDWLGLMTGGAR
jgi:phage virion morphogenesis protein